MPGPTTEVLSDDVKELRGDLHALAVDLAKIGTGVGIFKWMLGLTLMATVSGIATGIWWAATITSEVRHLSGQVAEIRAAIVPTAKANGK